MIKPDRMLVITALLLAPLVAQSATASPAYVLPIPAVAAKFSFADIIAGIGAAKPSPEIAAITSSTKVTFVQLHMLKGYDSTALSFSATQLKALIALDAEVGRNRALEAKLRKAGYLLSDVVAVSIDPAGGDVVFINL